MKLLPGALLPALFKVSGDLRILGEKSVFVRNAQVIEHRLDQIQMRHQDRLRQIGGEFVIVLAQARPHPRSGLAQRLRIQLVHVQPGLQPVEELIRLQFPHGNRAHVLLKVLLAQAQEDVAELH